MRICGGWVAEWLPIIGIMLMAPLEAKSPYTRCFQRFIRKSVDNYQPIVELFYVSPHQCLDQCISVTNNAVKNGLCKSFVYDHLQHSCRLYDHSGTQIPAILHPAIGFDFYRRTATTQQCAGPMQRFSRLNALSKPADSVGSFAAKSHQSVAIPIDVNAPPPEDEDLLVRGNGFAPTIEKHFQDSDDFPTESKAERVYPTTTTKRSIVERDQFGRPRSLRPAIQRLH